MHFCAQELVAIMMIVPSLGYVLLRGKHLLHRLIHRGSPADDGCCKHEPPHTESTEPVVEVRVHE